MHHWGFSTARNCVLYDQWHNTKVHEMTRGFQAWYLEGGVGHRTPAVKITILPAGHGPIISHRWNRMQSLPGELLISKGQNHARSYANILSPVYTWTTLLLLQCSHSIPAWFSWYATKRLWNKARQHLHFLAFSLPSHPLICSSAGS